ncbi:MraY family glycosyltransferase [Microvirga terricola]|uniref:Glycosyltransferase family 4 protein n=1 Tax=Microvirga terricola TaxID=2719797 RepID=A0ABX0V730_9HYPH|nr:glycosyltransferase family 4 protein [Microvirga terricola]NIX75614.1 glycosyltransferase family 4 protein [Microvirga terricola]
MQILLPLVASALLSALLIVVLKPLLIRYALARPNARSSHKVPTPQGGGIAIIIATLVVVAGALLLAGTALGPFPILAAATVVLGVVGAIDDIRPLPAGPRLALQVVAVAAITLTSDARLLSEAIPLGLERALIILAGVWFVNLVNFMDGLDWITVAEMVPITTFLALLGWAGLLPPTVALVAAALCGALLGFAPFNKPVARLFMGDVGSLPVGLLVGWMLLELAGTGALAAAILLPLYHLMDATITLLRRLARGEKVWQAHRSHFYQQATENGFSALSVSAHVFALNIALIALATVTLLWNAPAVQVVCLAAGVLLVSLLLRRFAARRPEVFSR